MSVFGIEIDKNSKVLDLRFFDEDEFPKEYLEITEFQYLNFVKIRKPWSKYDGKTIINDENDEEIYLLELNKYKLRTQLETLHVQIGLSERMKVDTTDLLAEFERVLALYNNLIKPIEYSKELDQPTQER